MRGKRQVVNRVRDYLDQRVMNACRQALEWQSRVGNDDRMIILWVETARDYAGNPDPSPKIIYVRFGYAIESIACAGLNKTYIYGLLVRTQVGHGHTRPDVVLSTQDGKVAWLDMTSVGFEGQRWRRVEHPGLCL